MNNDQEKIIFAQKIIQKKLIGKKLNYQEIYYLIDLIAKEKLSDILVAYFTAASFSNQFSDREIFNLIKAMVKTGDQLSFKGVVADKHSTGGVPGTRTSPIVVSIVAAAGFKIPKISSRAITTPAGTADVMEVLAKVDLSIEKVEKIVNKVNGCLVWNRKMRIAPADDVIIRVEKEIMFESFDKIIISILAKKIAAGANTVILDIPYGHNLKIKKENEAKMVLKRFIDLGKKFGLDITGELSEVKNPLSRGIGPALEAKEVLKILEQTTDRCLLLERKAINLAAKLLSLCFHKKGQSQINAYQVALEILASGKALKKFKEIIQAQEGDPNITSRTVPLGRIKQIIKSKKKGRIKNVNLYNLSSIAKILGAPKIKTAGIYLFKNMNDNVKRNEPLMKCYSENKENLEIAKETLENFPIFEVE